MTYSVHNARPVHTPELLPQLRRKLRNFMVRDRQGDAVGAIQDLNFSPQGRWTLLIRVWSQPARLVQLKNKRVQRVDVNLRSLFVDMSALEINFLPDYVRPAHAPVPSPIPSRSAPMPEAANSHPLPAAAEPAAALPSAQPISAPVSEIREEIPIRLLEERLVINRSKRKVGEVVVRKQIETEMIQVPIRRETLIVEQISPEHRQLAQVDLHDGTEFATNDLSTQGITQTRVTGEFTSLQLASQVLSAIAQQDGTHCRTIRIELELDDPSLHQTYQQWLNPSV